MPTGKITEWNRDRGFGYVAHEGKPLFVHIHEFAERTGTPVKGDIISFAVGVDRDGRPCAVRAVFRAGGRFKFWHFLFLALLLGAPGYALYRGLNPEISAHFFYLSAAKNASPAEYNNMIIKFI